MPVFLQLILTLVNLGQLTGVAAAVPPTAP